MAEDEFTAAVEREPFNVATCAVFVGARFVIARLAGVRNLSVANYLQSALCLRSEPDLARDRSVDRRTNLLTIARQATAER